MSQNISLKVFIGYIDENSTFYCEKAIEWIRLFPKEDDNACLFMRWLHCKSGMTVEERFGSMEICKRAMQTYRTKIM